MNSSCIVVTGHVDHGKTSLVRALTGIETDRLAEEKARGLSITPGFAHLACPSGTIDFIDAPGHEDFVQAMISGATGSGAVLLVVSAAEGIGAQTLEHLHIAGMLGITQGVIAVTKSDLLDPADRAVRIDDIRAALSRTPLAGARLVLCSARTGDGMDALRDALEALLSEVTPPSGPPHGFLPIDRVFSLPGRGTIVTGTLLGRDLALEDVVVLQPAGRIVSLRGLQSRGTERDLIHAGERMAANLRGLAQADIARGAVLCAAGDVAPSACVDVRLSLLPGAARAVKHMDDIRVLFGTSGEVATLRLFGGGRIAPGQTALAQLRFRHPVVGYAGQRAILRRLSPPETIGSAVFLDPQAAPTRAGDKDRLRVLDAVETGDAAAIARALCTARGGVARLRDVARLARRSEPPLRADLGAAFTLLTAGRIAPNDVIAARTADVLSAVATYHTRHPLRAMAPRSAIAPLATTPELARHVEDTLHQNGQIRRRDNRLALAGHDPFDLLSRDERVRLAEIEQGFRHLGLTGRKPDVLSPSTLDAALEELLIDAGRLTALHNVALNQTLVLHTDALTEAADRLRAAFPPPQSFTTSQARTALATSRRVIVPVLEHFDSCAVTERVGDTRRMRPANPVSPADPAC